MDNLHGFSNRVPWIEYSRCEKSDYFTFPCFYLQGEMKSSLIQFHDIKIRKSGTGNYENIIMFEY